MGGICHARVDVQNGPWSGQACMVDMAVTIANLPLPPQTSMSSLETSSTSNEAPSGTPVRIPLWDATTRSTPRWPATSSTTAIPRTIRNGNSSGLSSIATINSHILLATHASESSAWPLSPERPRLPRPSSSSPEWHPAMGSAATMIPPELQPRQNPRRARAQRALARACSLCTSTHACSPSSRRSKGSRARASSGCRRITAIGSQTGRLAGSRDRWATFRGTEKLVSRKEKLRIWRHKRFAYFDRQKKLAAERKVRRDAHNKAQKKRGDQGQGETPAAGGGEGAEGCPARRGRGKAKGGKRQEHDDGCIILYHETFVDSSGSLHAQR